MPTRFSTLLLALLLATGLTAQSQPAKPDGPYHLSLKREASYIGLGGLMLGAGTYFQGRVPEVTISELSLNDFKQVNAIDGAYGNIIENDDARLLSDKLLNFNAGLPLALILGRRMRRDFPRIAVLYVETMAITGGLTNLTKATILRTRPYVLGPDWDPDRLLESGDRASFISGHTSISAAGTFFFARVFTDYYPESKLKPVIWVVAAGLPAAAGYLRVRAAKHFPTDIVAGYAVGAAIGYLVPTLHKRDFMPRGLAVTGGANGVYLAYRF